MHSRILILLALCLACLRTPAQLLPPHLPGIQVVRHDNDPWCDYLYTEAMNWGTGSTPSLILMFDRRGEVAWYAESSQAIVNFALQPNGLMSYFVQGEHILLDSNFSITGGLGCKGGYANDLHDLIMTPDGRNFLICVDQIQDDLSAATTVHGATGHVDGHMAYTVIQELDNQFNLVREWKARPYYEATDCDRDYFQEPHFMDLNHTNSLDWDGRYLLMSNRHNAEVLMLDWNAGQIAWRLGGTKSDFAYTNDQGTDGQHDARFVGPGLISVFDNGTYHPAPFTRSLIYRVDTVAMTATRLAEYPSPLLLSSAMGGFRVLPDGRVVVANGWFAPSPMPNISIIHPGGQHSVDITFPEEYWSYRAQCHAPSWQLNRPLIQCEAFGNNLRLFLDESYSDYLWTTGETSPSIVVQDTGRFQVFVPKGMGRLGSNEFHIAAFNGQCPTVVHAQEATDPFKPIPRLVRTLDVMAREVRQREPRRVYFELYDDGKTRKVWVN